jgi:lactate dehydrogenase-like 2-hydroxyacid dehydrogenase
MRIMKIVLFDTKTLGYDLEFSPFERFGEVLCYDFSTEDECIVRGQDAEICISNKIQYTPYLLEHLPNVKLICLTSTGTNTIDLAYAKEKGIAVCNIKGYSTYSVAQHTFTLLFSLMSPMQYYDDYVKTGSYIDDFLFSHYQKTWNDLSGKTVGIVGLGMIGKQVGTIAQCFGANVIYYSTSGHNQNDQFERVTFDELIVQSDIISIHAPLNEKTMNLFDLIAFKKMKSNCIFLNLGRGAIVVEADLVEALDKGYIAKAGIDVLSYEPMTKNHPYTHLQQKDKLFVTPHIAWASIESRNKMIQEVVLNIESFLNGFIRNRVE